jgi:hypothetical protein
MRFFTFVALIYFVVYAFTYDKLEVNSETLNAQPEAVQATAIRIREERLNDCKNSWNCSYSSESKQVTNRDLADANNRFEHVVALLVAIFVGLIADGLNYLRNLAFQGELIAEWEAQEYVRLQQVLGKLRTRGKKNLASRIEAKAKAWTDKFENTCRSFGVEFGKPWV